MPDLDIKLIEILFIILGYLVIVSALFGITIWMNHRHYRSLAKPNVRVSDRYQTDGLVTIEKKALWFWMPSGKLDIAEVRKTAQVSDN